MNSKALDKKGKLFQISRRLTFSEFIIFWINAAIVFYHSFFQDDSNLVITIALIVLPICYVFCSLINSMKYRYPAESILREHAIEDGLENIDSNERSGYYTNDFNPSLARYAMNIFESVYYSEKTASKAFWLEVAWLASACIVIGIVALMPDLNEVLISSVQVIFLGYFIVNRIFFFFYYQKLGTICETFSSLLVKTGYSKKQDAVLMKTCIDYESLKSFCKIDLPEKVFIKHKESTGDDWNEIQQKAYKAYDAYHTEMVP